MGDMFSSSQSDADVKMWHKGIHIIDVPVAVQEPNYDEYYKVGYVHL